MESRGKSTKFSRRGTSNGHMRKTMTRGKWAPQRIIFDKEYLYDQAIQSKKETNDVRDQNRKIMVRMKFLERELEKRDSVIEDLMNRPN